ncbi:MULTISPECIES: helix-turn-helix domain-containing protein [Pseudoalteromonas]|uniref:helix-turn-helix domain-containing protein n=1 Tax=Pseudoalteromonas TaxID=53246 RepID=UPI000C7E6933|nr:MULTISPECIES: helix-turn-helix transcriptional regulator [unclassified Pseudoalteromonas]AUJ72220.1 Helix-turn-helix domain protein [Pseudoalteromonas sp. NC201]MCF2826028.1 helix-turn-helix domain-containing protein [Pseudoalteromonas sp. OF5H-5]MCF2831683.1 helix-turn-helix domain-containing protein [Pseudoalteromonas sp. DL2-H6]MCF2925023.1 helix-turn-helix domain-containing protein [Pseudoalteromonas sp. DL2-H1]
MGEYDKRFTGDDLRRMRKVAGKTTSEMARLAGVERGTYENYEKGVSKFPYEYFEIWCDACGVNLTPLRDQIKALREKIDDTKLWRKSPTPRSDKQTKTGKGDSEV